ncbi:mutS protein homolog 5-like [Malaya genurostris]|uniref:mutS protein homolog 5-like n=1 Tax=Malaya genurostris TaxID=325434 RepID=UPI0026F3BB59|nr:mutS protein homolog 5-like [Malaya genurostris]
MNETETRSSATQANKILSLCWNLGNLAAAYYDIDQLELYAIQQADEPRPQYASIRNLIRQYCPLFHLVSGPEEFISDVPALLQLPDGTRLQRLGVGNIESSEKARICDFGPKAINASFARVLVWNLPGIPPQATDSERRIFWESIVPFNQQLLIHAVACLLKLLDLMNIEGPVLTRIIVLAPESQLMIDDLSYQALQIFNSRMHPSGFKRNLEAGSCSVFNLFNRCSSKIGKAELKIIMRQPIRDVVELGKRFDTIQWLIDSDRSEIVHEMKSLIGNLSNVKLLYRKIVTKTAKICDWVSFKKSIYYSFLLCKLCAASSDPSVGGTPIDMLSRFVLESNNVLKQLLFTIDELVDLERGEREGKFSVKFGIDRKLDQIRHVIDESGATILETSRWDIENLPICWDDLYVTFLPSYGFVFSTSVTEELADPNIFERSSMSMLLQSDNTVYFQNDLCRVLNGQFINQLAEMHDREQAIVDKLIAFIEQVIPVIFDIFNLAARVDVFLAFASVAESQGYTRPTVTEKKVLRIEVGRHPLLEQFRSYNPNDTDIGGTNEHFMLILASDESIGKTIYLKEIALICYLAHIGSFVPAQAATIALLDSIYTRLDYPESVFSGKSSFMGELHQMSVILQNASSRSLVMIDEFGKGTTYSEGKSLLISSIEYLLQKGDQMPLTLIATQFTAIANYLNENKFLRIYQAHKEKSDEAEQSSLSETSSSTDCQAIFPTASQTMALTLLKNFLNNEIIDPRLVVQLYKSMPITQASTF